MSVPRQARLTDEIPVRVEELARWVVRYLQAYQPDSTSRLSTALGAATVLLRTDLKEGVMKEPTQQEKDLAIYLLKQSEVRGYTADETVAALCGVADGLALACVKPR